MWIVEIMVGFMLITELSSYMKGPDCAFNTLRPRQNGRHFADDIFKCIFLNENAWISINISLKFVPNGPINNIPALVQIMAWRRSGDKPFSEPLMVRLLTHICVTRPEWVNLSSVRYHYNGVNFLENTHKRHPLTRPLGLLWVKILIQLMPQLLKCCMKHRVISDRVITELDYIYVYFTGINIKFPLMITSLRSRRHVRDTSGQTSFYWSGRCHWSVQHENNCEYWRLLHFGVG